MLCFDILEDLSGELGDDLFEFTMINELTGELSEDMMKRYEYHVDVHRRYYGSEMDFIAFVGYHGDLEFIKWLYRRVTNKAMLFNGACLGGSLDVAEWLHSEGIKESVGVFDRICESGHTDLVRWMIKMNKRGDRCDYHTLHAIDSACSKGHFEIVKMVHYFLKEKSRNALYNACYIGRLDIVIWLYENGSVEGSPKLAGVCCERGHLNILKWIYYEKPKRFWIPSIEVILITACKYGNSDIVKWIHDESIKQPRGSSVILNFGNGEFDAELFKNKAVLYYAIVYGKDEIIKWFVENHMKNNNDYTCAIDVIDYICASGNLDLVKFWLVRHPKDKLENAIWCARDNGHHEIVEWLEKIEENKI